VGDGCNPDCEVPCGNGAVDHATELCDTEPPAGDTCIDYGFDRGLLGCSNVCTPDFNGCGLFGWQTVSSPANALLHDLHLLDGDHGWAVGFDGTIVGYQGGAWSPASSPTTERLYGVWASGPTDAWAVGTNGTILRYDGADWTVWPVAVTTEMLFAV